MSGEHGDGRSRRPQRTSRGQQVTIAGTTGGTGINGTFTIVTVNSSCKTFTYAVAPGHRDVERAALR